MTSISQSTAPLVCPHPASGFCQRLTNLTETMRQVCIFHCSSSLFGHPSSGSAGLALLSGEHYSVRSLVWIGGGVEAEGNQRGVPRSRCLKNRLKRLKQCSRYSWDWRKGKEEDINSHNKNWRYVTGLHLRPARLFSFLDNNAAKS